MECLTPYLLKDQDRTVPCNKCPECTARRISGWSFRLMQEYKHCNSAHFITLTYDTQHVPITPHGFMGLNKRHLQLFFKRLRKAHVRTDQYDLPIKYYAVGEYGTARKRPHYHIILFNAKLELIQDAWTCTTQKVKQYKPKRRCVHKRVKPKKIRSQDTDACNCGKHMGHVHYGYDQGVNEAEIGYTLAYMTNPWKPLHQNDDRPPQFSLMSKGLGTKYLTPQMISWHLADLNNRMYLNIPDGKKVSMPRYYKEKIYDEYTRQMIGQIQLEKMREKQREIIEKIGIEAYQAMQEQHKKVKFERQELANKKRSKF